MLTLPAKNWFIIYARASGKFTIVKGSCKIFNKDFKEAIDIKLNSGDSYLLYTESEVQTEPASTLEIEKILTNPLPTDWLTLKIDIRPVLKNRIMILGASDSGKTTLIKYLALNLPKKGEKIGLIDLDVGQNSLGLPGTINLSEFTLQGITPIHTEFFGHNSPAGNKDTFLQVIQKFFQSISSDNYTWLFIDTSGYIQTTEAVEINRGLLAIFKPQIVLLLGTSASELKQKLLTRNITYMKLSSAIEGIKKEKTPETRKRKRNERFLEYFKNALTEESMFKKITSIKVNYNNEINELNTNEAVTYFLENNIKKLINAFVEVESTDEKKKFFAKIQNVTEDRIMLIIPEHAKLPERYTLSIGSLYLDFM